MQFFSPFHNVTTTANNQNNENENNNNANGKSIEKQRWEKNVRMILHCIRVLCRASYT